jgi:ATPase subunit of ABC transporter with duplicated ATPase domains
MIADIHITEKSFGDKTLMKDVKFSVDDGEKVGVVGRNGVGKSTLFGIYERRHNEQPSRHKSCRVQHQLVCVLPHGNGMAEEAGN